MNKKINYLPFENKIIKKKKQTDDGIKYYNTCAYCGNTIEYLHGVKSEFCPICRKDDYIKPITETRLFLLQKEYFDNKRDPEILGSMYLLLEQYSESIVKKMLPSTFTYHFDKVKEKATDASNLIISQYLEKRDFKIEKSFAGYLRTKIKQVLWNKKLQNEENHESIYTHLSNENDKEVLQIPDVLNMSTIFPNYSEYRHREQEKEEILNGLEILIDRIIKTIGEQYNNYHKLLTLIGLYQYIQNKGDLEKFYSNFGTIYIKELVDKSMVLIYEFLKEH